MHVACGLDRLAAHRQHVLLHHPVDPRDADGAEKSPPMVVGMRQTRSAMSTVTEKADGDSVGM